MFLVAVRLIARAGTLPTVQSPSMYGSACKNECEIKVLAYVALKHP